MRMCNNKFEDSRHRLGRSATVANRTKHPHEKELTKELRGTTVCCKMKMKPKSCGPRGAPKAQSKELRFGRPHKYRRGRSLEKDKKTRKTAKRGSDGHAGLEREEMERERESSKINQKGKMNLALEPRC